MTIRAMVTAPDFYKVGVATNPVADHYDHMAYAIESYMGLPQENKEAYEKSSSLKLAHKLKGKLLLIHSTNDVNATFSSTMKMCEALIRADKPFDLLVMPNQDHHPKGQSARYWLDAVRRYFQEHLKPE
jgi:dipeptidyl aminopeptidase/acylaminoacyl peptidase